MTAWFETWFDTEYYHILYKNRSYEEADAFVERLFAEGILRPGMRILELACGKGRHARAMHRLGATVVGVDLSPHSITAAKEFEVEGLSFYVHDMRAPFPDDVQGFDAVTNLFTSFGYFDDEADNLVVLQNVAQVLKPGGTFVLDFMNVELILARLKPIYDLDIDGVHFHIHKKYEGGKIIKTIYVDDTGTKAGPYQERVQALTPTQLGNMAQEAGLDVIDVFGSYTLEALVADKSPRCILICKG